MPEKFLRWIACVVINKDNKILLLKRSADKYIYPNLWAVVAGGLLDNNEDPEIAAKREVHEELGIDLNIIKIQKGFEIDQEGSLSFVYPFLFEHKGGKLTLNYEHTRYRWVKFEDLNKLELVPQMITIISKLLKVQINDHKN